VTDRIELGIEKMNQGNWLKVTIPYITQRMMTATLKNDSGQMLKKVRLASGNNLIDLESITQQSIHIKIDTPFETILKEMYLG